MNDVNHARTPSEATTITADMLSLVQLDQHQIDAVVATVPGGAKNVQDIYPLSSPQEGILFHRLLNLQGDAYVLSTLFELQSHTQLKLLSEALQKLIERHDILRTAVLWEQLPLPIQVVYRRADLPVEELAPDPDRRPIEQLRARMAPSHQAMDIRRAPLAKLVTAADADGRWYALVQFHHLACDDQSWRMAIEELMTLLDGRDDVLPEPLPYRTYVAQLLTNAGAQQAQAFFSNKLGDIDESTAPFGLLDVHSDGSRMKQADAVLDPELALRVRQQARRVGVSPARLFHAAWSLVVARTSGREDVVFGTVLLTMRQKPGATQRLLGMVINTLPLRLRLQDVSAEELVRQTHRELSELLQHQQASLTVAQQCSAIAGTAPLFTALINYRHRLPGRQDEPAGGVRIVAQRGARTNYPITLAVDDLGEGFAMNAQTAPGIDPQRILGYVQTAVQSLTQALEETPHAPVLTLAIIPRIELRTIVDKLGGTRAIFAGDKLIHQLFEQQALRTPNAIAVLWEQHSLTYGELNRNANRLAWHLRSKGVGPDRLVGICVERGIDMIVGLLAILKAGGAYVPLDPNYPTERLHYMLQDADPGVVLTQEHLRATLPDTRAQVVAIDGDREQISTHPETDPDALQAGLRPDHLAYVMYTSGSTGKPKGVMVEHRNVARLFAATRQWFEFTEKDVWTLFHSYAFDFTVWEIWGALLYGGQLVVVPYATARSASDFYRLLCDRRVTVLSQTPSAFAQLIDAQAHLRQSHCLRTVVFGGEASDLRKLRPWVERNGTQLPRLVNMYGITETTVHVTYCCLSAEQIASENGSPIGTPIPDLRLLLLDRWGQPVPIGVAGEMYVGGAGVARGYLNRPELTAERFVIDPRDPSQRARLYKSGDLGRWREDGTLEYLGRNDHQVKIRGFRIELGEIEAQLALHDRVKDTAVVVREDVPGEKRLVAYVVPLDPADAPSAAELRAHLRSTLPDHMVPPGFVMIESLPLTANGKLDRRALPAPGIDAYAGQQYQHPEGATEEALASLWGELLQLQRISRDDNFFELGGHSLLAMQLISRLQSSQSIELSMRTLFEKPTLRELAAHVAQLHETSSRQPFSDVSVERLLDELSSMSDSKVEALLQELTAAGRQ